jgi:hypothetical protein
MGLNLSKKEIIKNPIFFAENMDIKISVEDIKKKITAYDWLEICDCKNDYDFKNVVNQHFSKITFKSSRWIRPFIKIRYAKLFFLAVRELHELISAVSKAYNTDVAIQNNKNDVLNKLYYLSYWAKEKNLPLNIHETNDLEKNKYNLESILISILKDKKDIYDEYSRQKKQ